MGKELKENMKNLSLGEFAVAYIGSALNKLSNSPPVEVFDETVRQEVSEMLGIDAELVKELHHPFHWELFLKEGHLGDYVQLGANGQENFVRLKRDYVVRDIRDISRKVMQEDGDLLQGSYARYLKCQKI